MKSDVILINNKGGGTDLALEQVKRSAALTSHWNR